MAEQFTNWQDAAAKSQRLIRVKDLYLLFETYYRPERDRLGRLELNWATHCWSQDTWGALKTIDFVLTLPRNWPDLAINLGNNLVQRISREDNEKYVNFLVRQSQATFSRDEAFWNRVLNGWGTLPGVLTQNYPRDLEALASKSRGHRRNRGLVR